VQQALASICTNKYSEGYPGKRYYGGNQYIDQIELLCIDRLLKCFNLDKEKWFANVQTLSGSPANFAVFTALLNPNDKIMGMDLPSGGHLSHGYQTENKKISSVSKYFNTKGYKINDDGWMDMKNVENQIDEFKPNLIICGGSA